MNKFSFSLPVLLLSLVAAGTCPASSLGTDITISDKNNNGTNAATASNWYSNREDNETENSPNTITTQQWDLEAMYLDGTLLTLVGGYDFKNGVTYAGHTYRSGDIFVDVDGDAQYGSLLSGNANAVTGGTTTYLFGYDYVLDLTFGSDGTGTFVIRDLHTGTNVRLARPADVASSGAWTYSSGSDVATVDTGTFTYGQLTSTQASALGLLGGDSAHGNDNNHYYLSIDVSYFSGTTDIFHYTMECGNDNLMGQACIPNVPDAASTALLLGGGLVALAGWRRRALR